jgi:hypothetical protein
VIIRADRAFFEAMQEAGYSIEPAQLKAIYAAAKAKRKANKPTDDRQGDFFTTVDNQAGK